MNRGARSATAIIAGASAPAGANAGRAARWVDGVRLAARARASLMSVLAAGSVLVLTLEFLKPTASEAPTLRATIETGLTLFALATAWLMRAQFAQTRQRRDLLLLAAVLTLGLVHLCAYAVPSALAFSPGSYLTAWALWGELIAAGIFAAAAAAPRGKLVLSGRPPALIVAEISLLVVASSGVAALLLRGDLVPAAGPVHRLDAAVRHPLACVLVVATASLFAYTAVRLAWYDRANGVEWNSLLAGAATLLSAAWLSRLAGAFGPSVVTPAEGLRMLAFGLILAAALRRELQVRTLAARGAAIAERQRVARDLHDGLAQDLACIAAHGQHIATHMGSEHPVAIAARRALQIARCAIVELSDLDGATAHESLEAIAAELRSRFEITIAVGVDLCEDLAADVQADLTRITREAIANAARHGGAKNVMVSLSDAEGAVTLRVHDDGRGIRAGRGDSAAEGFGLRSMRERASALGGHMTVAPLERTGTLLEVVLP